MKLVRSVMAAVCFSCGKDEASHYGKIRPKHRFRPVVAFDPTNYNGGDGDGGGLPPGFQRAIAAAEQQKLRYDIQEDLITVFFSEVPHDFTNPRDHKPQTALMVPVLMSPDGVNWTPEVCFPDGEPGWAGKGDLNGHELLAEIQRATDSMKLPETMKAQMVHYLAKI